MGLILVYELFILATTIILWSFMTKNGYKNVNRKFLILFLGVLLFEIISEPMWLNMGFSSWAYLFRDLTWVLTLGWVNTFMIAILAVDNFFKDTSEKKRFFLYLLFIGALIVPAEGLMLFLGVRGYAPFLLETMSGLVVPLLKVPVESIFAVPIFSSLILAFYKYLNYLFDTK
jgi:hypothetical protein|tara:strand:+ start:10126 stop:10644 length:519 start_codon:yes stop_codon:yes gene_type:complete